jgi:predicted ATPase/class 3 adenylate cyclase
MTNPPSGTVTFLFTDIEGSTKLAREQPDAWESTRARHHVLLREAIERHNGYVFQIIGDAFCASFQIASDALKAALDAQRALQGEAWDATPIKVRMGLHTGTAQAEGIDTVSGGYVGYTTMALTQRVMSAAHGGQALLSQSANELARRELPIGITLRDMGEHQLKGLLNAEHLWQIVAPDLRQDFPPLSTLNAIPHNLPEPLTSFIGREADIAEVERLLSTHRLVTLTGPGGTGKTRLALEVARRDLEKFKAGVWLVELAPILDPLLVPRTTALAIDLRDEPRRPVIDMLCDYLREKKMLIILDNCEHLVEACARMADRILHAAPQVHILASSREALGIAGEVTYRVPSLGLPDMQYLSPVESLSKYEAVRLFIDRARSAVSTFSVTNDNAPALAQICHRLDGIPLAIELAAAKVHVLSVEQIAKRLDDRFRLLTGGSRTALERHQTLRAAIDWSYNLLPSAEQTLFRRLAIFLNGWTLEAAESVCTDGSIHRDDVLNLLEQLINKSLVIADEMHGETRFHALETMRQYANEKLVESGESDMLRDKHLDCFLNLAEIADPHLRRPEQIEWLKRLEAENENMRAALAWAMDKPSAEPVLRLSGALGIFWDLRSLGLEGAKWLDKALGKARNENSKAEKAARAKALYRRTVIADELDEFDIMKASAESALALCEEVPDFWGIAYSRVWIGNHAFRSGLFRESRSSLEQSLKEFRRLGDAWGESWALTGLGWALEAAGEIEELREIRQRAVACARVSGDRNRIARALIGMAWLVSFQFHQWDEAEMFIREAEHLYAEIGSPDEMIIVGNLRYRISFARGDFDRAKTEAKLLVEHCARVGERNLRADALDHLARIADAEHDLSSAIGYSEKALELEKEMGAPTFIAYRLILTGLFKYQRGDGAVKQYVNEGMEFVRRSGVTTAPDLFRIFCYLGGLFVEKQPQIAVKILAHSESMWQTFRAPWWIAVYDKPYFDRFLSTARAKLNETDFTLAWEAGLRMTTEEAVELASATIESMPNA